MTSIRQPLVSICIPIFNGARYIEACMDSALSQTYQNLEIIVSDDASSDNTLALIEAYKSKTDIPIFIHNHKPNGIGANWNNCIKHAHGDYIKFLFQDDILYPTSIARMVAFAQTDTKVGLVYTKRDFIYEKETPEILEFKNVYGNLHKYWYNIVVETGIIDGVNYLKDREILNSPKNKIGEPTNVLIKKECFEKVGLFNEFMKQALDCEFWYRIMPHYKIAFIDEVLSGFRLHSEQASAKNKSKNLNETELLYKMFYNDLYKFLDKKNQWKLKKRFHPFLSFLVNIKNRIK